MDKTVKCLLLKVDNVIVTEIIEIGSEGAASPIAIPTLICAGILIQVCNNY